MELSVDLAQLAGYTETEAYDGALWQIAFDSSSGQPVGCGIADFDREAKEGILEWIQVLPEYRRRGVGAAIVERLLWLLKDRAEFVTVSGRVNSEPHPEALYRRCGFTGNDVWHILKGK